MATHDERQQSHRLSTTAPVRLTRCLLIALHTLSYTHTDDGWMHPSIDRLVHFCLFSCTFELQSEHLLSNNPRSIDRSPFTTYFPSFTQPPQADADRNNEREANRQLAAHSHLHIHLSSTMSSNKKQSTAATTAAAATSTSTTAASPARSSRKRTAACVNDDDDEWTQLRSLYAQSQARVNELEAEKAVWRQAAVHPSVASTAPIASASNPMCIQAADARNSSGHSSSRAASAVVAPAKDKSAAATAARPSASKRRKLAAGEEGVVVDKDAGTSAAAIASAVVNTPTASASASATTAAAINASVSAISARAATFFTSGLHYIYSFLPLSDTAKVTSVCRYWYTCATSERLKGVHIHLPSDALVKHVDALPPSERPLIYDSLFRSIRHSSLRHHVTSVAVEYVPYEMVRDALCALPSVRELQLWEDEKVALFGSSNSDADPVEHVAATAAAAAATATATATAQIHFPPTLTSCDLRLWRTNESTAEQRALSGALSALVRDCPQISSFTLHPIGTHLPQDFNAIALPLIQRFQQLRSLTLRFILNDA